jgi:putative ABC transport system permease protein
MRGSKWKLFLIVFLMAAAFINLIFVTALFSGIINMFNNQTINTYTGNVMILPKDSEKKISSVDTKIKDVEAISEVKAATAQVVVPGTLEHNNISGSWTVLAMDPEKDKKVTNISTKIISGGYLDQNDKNGVIIGRQIAGGDGVEMDAFSLKGVEVGDKIELTSGEIKKEYTLRGIFYTKYIYADQQAYITKASLDELMPGFYKDSATRILVKTEKGNEDKVIQQLKDIGIEESIYSWEDASGMMKSVTGSFTSINVLLSIVGVLIAAFTIFIVVYIDIADKKQQIGILRAIGIKPYIIDGMYIMQTVVYSCFGVILGTVIFLGGLVTYFNHYPFVLPIGDASLSVNYADLFLRAETIIFVAIGAGLIPAIMVTRMKLLDAIWGK